MIPETLHRLATRDDLDTQLRERLRETLDELEATGAVTDRPTTVRGAYAAEEREILHTLWSAGATDRVIGAALGRSGPSVKRFRIRQGWLNLNAWEHSELAVLQDLVHAFDAGAVPDLEPAFDQALERPHRGGDYSALELQLIEHLWHHSFDDATIARCLARKPDGIRACRSRHGFVCTHLWTPEESEVISTTATTLNAGGGDITHLEALTRDRRPRHGAYSDAERTIAYRLWQTGRSDEAIAALLARTSTTAIEQLRVRNGWTRGTSAARTRNAADVGRRSPR